MRIRARDTNDGVDGRAAFARGKHQSAAQSQLSAEQLKKAQEADQDYKTSLDRIPDQKGADRWGNAR